MDSDEETVFKTPIKRKKNTTIVDEDDILMDKGNSGNNKKSSDINNDDVDNGFKTPSPKISKSRLKRIKSSPSSDIEFTPSPKSAQISKNSTPNSTTSSPKIANSPSPYKPTISPPITPSPKRNQIKKKINKSPISSLDTQSPLKSSPLSPIQIDNNNNNDNDNDNDNPWDFSTSNIKMNDDGTMSNENQYFATPEKYSSPSKQQQDQEKSSSPQKTVNKKNEKDLKISNKKVILRSIKDKDLLSFKGVSKLYNSLKLSGFSTKQSNKANLEKLFGVYSKWSKELNPNVTLENSIINVEKLGRNRIVRNHIDDLKNGIVFSYNEQKDNDNDMDDIKNNNDDFGLDNNEKSNLNNNNSKVGFVPPHQAKKNDNNHSSSFGQFKNNIKNNINSNNNNYNNINSTANYNNNNNNNNINIFKKATTVPTTSILPPKGNNGGGGGGIKLSLPKRPTK
ncbi:hypothetical protein ACTFIV_004027 [Dictyostelium citrinum]